MATAKRARTNSKKAPATAAASVTAVTANGIGASAFDLESAIRARAFELYEKRGRQDGLAQQDWYQAESEILTQHSQRSA